MISLLYIDDEPGLLELGKLFLESAGGFEVSTALSGDEGLGQLAQHDFDAIVSDFQMPGMDGIELLKKVRKSFGTIPFVLFTGRGREEVVIEAINNGVDFYLQKGGDPKAQFAELAHKVRQSVSRRKAETALSDSEKRLADIINFLPDATFAIDTQGVVIAWNRAMERMTGLKSEEILGKGDYEYALPFYHERRPLLINLVLDNDPAIGEKYPFVKKEGRTLFSEITIPHFNEGTGAALWFTASPLYDRKGEVVGAIESIREITERKRAEEELVSANREYTNLLDQIQDVYYRSDSQGRLVRASRSWATLLGYNDVSECIGRNIANDFYFNPSDREQLLAVIAKNGKVTGYEVTLKKKDGTPVIVEVSSHPYFDPAGTTIGIEGMFRDITGRKKAEEERRESEKRFRELAELLPQGVYETDIHGRMTYVNRLALEMYGYTDEDIRKGVSVADAIAPEDRQRAAEAFHRMAVVGTYPKGNAEYLALRKDGTTFPIAIYSSQILRDGRITGVRGSIIDITERKKAEDEIRAANEQLVASDEELRAQYDELALGEKRVRMSESRLRYMLGFNEYAKKSEKELLGYAIEGAGVVTDSPLGYLAFLNEDESELAMYAWSKNAMAECSMITKPVVYKTEKTGLWGEAVRQRRAVITNDYAAPDPAKKGYPEGHPRIVRHMNVPVIDEGHVILVAGVANKQSDYTENDVNELLLLMQGLWNILKRRRAEETRNESEAKYRNIIDNAPAGMHFYELKPDGSLVFTGSNPGADRILGVVHHQFIGKTIEEAFPPLVETEVPAQYRRVAAEGGTWQTDHVTYDGEAIRGAYAVTAFQTSPGAMVAMFIDITKRKRAEQNEQNTIAFLNALIDQNPNSLWVSDSKGFLIRMNAACRRLLHSDEKELAGKYNIFQDNLIEEQGFMPLVRSVFDDGRVVSFPLTYESARLEVVPLKDNVSLILEVTIFPVRDAAGTITNAVIIHNDITERKRAETNLKAAYEQVTATEEELRQQVEEISESERRLREKTEELDQYFSASLDLFCIADTGGYFRRLNPEWEKTLGYSLAELEGKRFLDFVHPDDMQTTIDVIGDLKSQKEVLNFTNRYRHRDGTYRWIEWRSMPKGDLVFAAARDITGRKNAEAALIESEAKYRNIINHAPAGMHFYELKPDGSLVFTGSNPGADRILGVVHHQFIGKTIEEAFPPLVETEVPAQYRKVAAEGGTWQTEQIIYDGVAIHGAYAVTAFQTSPGAMVAMFMDITKRKRAETDLKAAYELVAAAEEELREQYDTLAAAQAEISSRRQQLEEIASTVPGVVYQFWARPDGSRGMYYASNRTNEIFGLDPDLERFFPEFTAGVHPDDRPAFLSSIDDAVKRGTDWHFEGRFTRHSGETIWFEGISSPVVHGDELVFTGVILDITERKRMEETIRESEGRYRSLVELSPDAVVVHQGGKILYANPAALRLAGAKQDEEIIGKEVISFIHPDDRAMALEDFRQLYEEGRIIPLKEERLLRVNGDPYTVEVIASPIQYQGSLSVLVVFRDVTERKRAEAALRESEEKYRSLVENIPFGITLIDADHRIVISNAAQGQMFHTDAGLWVGRHCYREFEKRDAVCTHCPGTRAMATGVCHEVETEGVRDDGTRFNARIHAIPLADNEGRGTRFIEVVEDITERKKAEDALRQNEEKYRALVETTGTGFVILDHVGRVLDANPEYIRMTGHTRLEDISGRSVTEWTAAHEQERNADAVRQCIRDGFIRNFEIDYTDNSGAITPVEINATVVQSEGAVHILTLCRDITDRKRAEDELLHLKISTDRSSDEIFWMDFAGNILYVNDAACQVTGYSREEFLKMKIFELDPDFLPGVWDASVADLRERKTQFITTRHRRKDGVIIDVEIVAVYVNQYDQEYSFAYVRDVTGRKRTEEALFSSQQMLQAVLDSIPQRVFWKDRNSVFLGCNKPLALDAGYADPADLVGKTDYDHASYATADLYRADDRQVMETGQPRINYEEPQIRPDGSQAWLRTTKVPLRNKEGAIIGVLGTYEDITDQKQAREALRESEEKYRTLVESSFDGIAIHQDGILVYVNRTAARILGADDPGIFAGKPAIEVVAPAFRERITDRVHRGPERSQELIHEQFLKTDGTAIDVDVTTTPCTWKGKPAVYVTFRDITAQVRAEEAFRESSRKYAELFELGSEALFLIDNETGALLETNSAACEMYGYPRDILLTMKNTDLSAEQEETRKVTTETPQGIVRVPLRYHRRRDGTVFPVEIIGRFFVWNGRPVHIAAIRDITEHKRAEAALVESEEKYRTLVEVNRDIIYSLNSDGTILYVSPQALTQIGYQPDEMVGRNFIDFIHPGDTAMLLNHIQENIRTGNLGRSDRFRVHRKDGVYRWFEDNTIYTTDRQQRPVIVGTIRDITEEKAAQDALRESEARLSSILHGSPVLQFVIDQNHHVISWNKALEEYSGIKAADIIGTDQQWRAFYPEKRAVLADLLVDGNTDAISRLYAGKFRQSRYVEEAFEATDYFPHMGSSGIWLSFTAAPIRDMQGNIIGAVETLEDVTERVTAENALRESSERTRTILDTAQAGIILVDATNHTIVDANKKALELIGLDRDSVIGAVCHRFICPAEQGKCPVTDCGQKVDTSERILITAAGEKIPVLKTVVPVSISGRDVLVESFVDIAEQKRSEAAIREANRKLNLLNSITRHDIRNQLTVALGYTQLAALSRPDPVVVDFLARITAAIETIRRQIEFTKAYQELGVHAPAWFRLVDVISIVRPETVTLYNTCKAVEIFADPMIDRVFFNLFDNAMKYGERVTTVTVGCGKRKNSLVITFADNGVGIAPGEKQKIFEKGYGKNTGLGLFLVREILAITDITISETGTPGEGAVFEIVVPEGAYRNAE